MGPKIWVSQSEAPQTDAPKEEHALILLLSSQTVGTWAISVLSEACGVQP